MRLKFLGSTLLAAALLLIHGGMVASRFMSVPATAKVAR